MADNGNENTEKRLTELNREPNPEPKVLTLLGKGFEELELVAPVDLLRRAGVKTVMASTETDLLVAGRNGIRIQADCLLDDCATGDFDLLYIPGGPAVSRLREDPRVLDLVKEFQARSAALAAICAAPTLLAQAGILQGKTVTSFPGVRAEVEPFAAVYTENRVESDGNLLTSRGAGTAEEFGLALVERLCGKDKAEAIRLQVVARAYR